MKHLVQLILLTLIAACGPIQISGASLPTDQTHPLSKADITYAEGDECLHVVTGDAAQDLAANMVFFSERAVKIQVLKKDVWPYATALRGRVLVRPAYPGYSDNRKVQITGHERVHYCQRDQFEGNDFERAYAFSNNRFRFEVPAYRMDLRAMNIQGVSDDALCKHIERLIEGLRDSYWLWDLNPIQYEGEARRIWSLELDSGACVSP